MAERQKRELTGGHEWPFAKPPQSTMQWQCGWCGNNTTSTVGLDAGGAKIRVCFFCAGPTVFDAEDNPTPGSRPGDEVGHLPGDVQQLYDEARTCISVGASSAAIMLFRKIIMHVAVEKGAAKDLKFFAFVDHIVDNHHVPAGAKVWVDYIRKVGNQETHEIRTASVEEAEGVLVFVTQLLKNVYELPNSVPAPPAPASNASGN